MKKIGDTMAIIYGPPGTGKTTSLLKLVDIELFENRVPVDEVAFVTFTRAARQEAKDRLRKKLKHRLNWDQPRWWRTLHSMAFTLLKCTRHDILSASDMREFTKSYGYALSDAATSIDADPSEVPVKTEDDKLRYVYEFSRNRAIPIKDGPRYSDVVVDTVQYHQFVTRYEAFKKEKNKYDFNDLVLRAIREELTPDVNVAFIDEAQDLSPLLISACEAWFAHCDRVYVAGDDDQCIYAWSGADSSWMLDLRTQADDVEILPQSYRVPSRVHTVAQSIIRSNTRRVDKTYLPRSQDGLVASMTRDKAVDYIKRKNAPCFILVRNRWCMKRIVQDLFTSATPYAVEGYGARAPLSKTKNVKALLAALKIKDNRAISGTELRALLDVIPSREAGQCLIPYGVKARAKAIKKDYITPAELIASLGLETLIATLVHDVTDILRSEPTDTRRYFRDLIASGYNLEQDPPITVMTIHGSKGREADTVIIVPDMTQKTYKGYLKDPEPENRCAYVAVTRAKKELILLKPETIYAYNYERHLC